MMCLPTLVIASDWSTPSVITRLLVNLSYILKLNKKYWLHKYFYVTICLNKITLMSGLHVSLQSPSKARSIYLNQGRQRAMLAAIELVMLTWWNTDNTFGCTWADFWKEGIDPVFILWISRELFQMLRPTAGIADFFLLFFGFRF